jgi:hypothetical protein
MDTITLTVITGKIIALETGLLSGLLFPEYIRIEAQGIIREHEDLPDDLRERIKPLLTAGLSTTG